MDLNVFWKQLHKLNVYNARVYPGDSKKYNDPIFITLTQSLIWKCGQYNVWMIFVPWRQTALVLHAISADGQCGRV